MKRVREPIDGDVRFKLNEDRGERFTRVHVQFDRAGLYGQKIDIRLSSNKADLAIMLLNEHGEIKLEFEEQRHLYMAVSGSDELAFLIEMLGKIQARISYPRFLDLKGSVKSLKGFRDELAPYIAEEKLLHKPRNTR